MDKPLVVHPASGQRGQLGGLAALHPTVLLLCLLLLVASVLTLDPGEAIEAALIVVATASWLIVSGITLRRVMRTLLFGCSLFLPVYLFAPWLEGGDVVVQLTSSLDLSSEGLLIPTRIVLRGLACLFIGVGLAAATDISGLAAGLARIPLVPQIVVVMTVQTLRWSEVLLEESRGIIRAIILRGGGGWRGGIALVRSLPLVWLPRVIARAERVTAAMEVRGYGGELPDRDRSPLRAVDVFGLSLALILAIVAGWMRWS